MKNLSKNIVISNEQKTDVFIIRDAVVFVASDSLTTNIIPLDKFTKHEVCIAVEADHNKETRNARISADVIVNKYVEDCDVFTPTDLMDYMLEKLSVKEPNVNTNPNLAPFSVEGVYVNRQSFSTLLQLLTSKEIKDLYFSNKHCKSLVKCVLYWLGTNEYRKGMEELYEDLTKNECLDVCERHSLMRSILDVNTEVMVGLMKTLPRNYVLNFFSSPYIRDEYEHLLASASEEDGRSLRATYPALTVRGVRGMWRSWKSVLEEIKDKENKREFIAARLSDAEPDLLIDSGYSFEEVFKY